ncbi:MAG TPA: SMP-30/gluconolactonase/LRE family protein [Thermomicrobiales bacterium]|nr:SMP-30/gluconolactonase/LRE family protein [Thermomicrobiales bacterium]
MTPAEPKLLLTGFDSPEGPAFDHDGNLFFVNWLTHQIMKLTPTGELSKFYNTGGIPAGLAFHPDGSLWVADEGDAIHGLLRITPDGVGEIVCNTYHGQPLNGANDLVFDRNGTVYFSDPWGSSETNRIGGFYRRFANGDLEQIDSGLAFPNGVAIDHDGHWVYLAETYTNLILRYPIGTDGAIGAREDFARLEAPFGPDGMAFDAAGILHVAHYGAGRIERIDTDGTLLDPITIPGAGGTTNCAFGGPDLRTLVITDVTSASLFTVAVDTPGQALHDSRR